MDEVLIDPDTESALVAYLSSVLTGVAVSTERPDIIPDKYIKINIIGGAGRSELVITNHLVTVECWGLDSVQASTLARQAHAYIVAAEGSKIGGVTIYTVDAGVPVNFPDVETRQSRYLFTVSLLTRATIL